MSDLRSAMEQLVQACRAMQPHVPREAKDHFGEALKHAEAAIADAQRQPGPWMKWDGSHETQAYDVWVSGCDVVMGCWPGGDGAMFATDGTGRRWRPDEVLAIRVSGYQGSFPAPFKKVLVNFNTSHGIVGVSQETLDEPPDAELPKATVGFYKSGRRASRGSHA